MFKTQFISDNLPTKISKLNIASKLNKIFIKVLVLTFVINFTLPLSSAIAVDNQTLEQQKKEAQQKLSETTTQKIELSTQLRSMDSVIDQAQQEINKTSTRIIEIEGKVKETNTQIEATEAIIEQKRKQIGEFIHIMYVNGQTSQIELLFGSDSFTDYINRSQYLENMQDNIRKATIELSEKKEELNKSLNELEILKAEASQALATQLAKQGEIEAQRSAKNRLLEITKGDEAEYKKLIANIQKQINDNNSRVWGSGNVVSQGSVKKGDIIGYIGNSGYSTGAHLHFEIRSGDGIALNPMSYINNGYFIDPAPSVSVNVPFGYSEAYFTGVFHSGIDKADGGAGTPIRAVADGEIVGRVSGRPNTYYSDPQSYEYGNYVKILHTNGMYSLYGHLR